MSITTDKLKHNEDQEYKNIYGSSSSVITLLPHKEKTTSFSSCTLSNFGYESSKISWAILHVDVILTSQAVFDENTPWRVSRRGLQAEVVNIHTQEPCGVGLKLV